MHNRKLKIITCAILLSHVSSFAMMDANDYLSVASTSRNSDSMLQNLANINAMIQNQQPNNVQRQVNNAQRQHGNHNNNQQQANNSQRQHGNQNNNQQQVNNAQRQHGNHNNNQQQANNAQRQHGNHNNNQQQVNNAQRQHGNHNNNQQQVNNAQRQQSNQNNNQQQVNNAQRQQGNHNNNQQQVNNVQMNNVQQVEEDPYGAKVFEECLGQFQEPKNNILQQTPKIEKYIKDQENEQKESNFIKRKTDNIYLYIEYNNLINSIVNIMLIANNQKYHNDKIIESNKNKLTQLKQNKEGIKSKISDCNSQINKIMNSYNNNFRNMHNDLNKYLDSKQYLAAWYNNHVSDNINEQKNNIKNCKKIVLEITDLSNNTTKMIQNTQQTKQALEQNQQDLQNRIKIINDQNSYIDDLYVQYKKIYDEEYKNVFDKYNDKLKDIQYINSDKYLKENFNYFGSRQKNYYNNRNNNNFNNNFGFKTYSRNFFPH